MIQFSPKEGITLLAVEVPEDATNFVLDDGDLIYAGFYFNLTPIRKLRQLNLEGKWSIVGRSDELGDIKTEFNEDELIEIWDCIIYYNGEKPDKTYLILKKQS